jgi:hypothetical protein
MVRRTAILLAALLLAGCAGAEQEPIGPSRAAEPQRAALGWRESYPATGPRLVFGVEKLTVSADGWSADVWVTNRTGIAFDTGSGEAASAYGLMLFATGDLGELEDDAQAGRLPAVRRARTIEPALPKVLGPNQTWQATLSAPGSLADGSWVRVSFGPLRARGEPPPEMEPTVVWITDNAYRV